MRKTTLQRQSFLGENSDHVLEQCRVAIVGLGGGGSHTAQQLAHVGVGGFYLFDPQCVEETNLNRLVGATMQDVSEATPKVTVAARLIAGLNPTARVYPLQEQWQMRAEVLRECDVIFGCVDSFSERDQLERAARRFLTPYIDIGMDVHPLGDEFVISGQVAVSLPGEPCLWCMGLLTEERLAQEAAQYGTAGGRPQVVWPNGILASTAVGTFMQLVLPWHRRELAILLEYDGNGHTVASSNKLSILKNKACNHFGAATDLGDPFWEHTNINGLTPTEGPAKQEEKHGNIHGRV